MTASQELSGRAPKTGPWIIGYAVSVGLAFYLTGSGIVTDTTVGSMLWLPVALCAAMVVITSWRRHRLLGTLSPAVRAFRTRIVAACVVAFLGFAVSGIVWDMVGRQALWTRLLALLPYIGFAGIIWSVHRYIGEEQDEYLRAQSVRQILIASFVTLTIASLWGGLAYAGLTGQGWVGIIILVWFAGMGVGRLVNEMRP